MWQKIRDWYGKPDMAQVGRSHLSREERKNPVLAIVEVFEGTPHELLRMGLWKLLKSATSELSWTQVEGPDSALEFQASLEKLMEACLLLLWQKEQLDGEMPVPVPPGKPYLRTEQQVLSDYRRNIQRHGGSIFRLSRTEAENPYRVVKAFYAHLPILGWKGMLDEWVEHALSNVSLLQDSTDSELILRYEQLEKLLEVAYLFYLNHC